MRGEQARRTIVLTVVWCITLVAVLGLVPRAAASEETFGHTVCKLENIETFADLLTVALANSRDIKAAEYQLAAARAGLKQVEAYLNPQFQATASYAVANYPESIIEVVKDTKRTTTGTLTWMQQLGPNKTLQTGLDKGSIAVEQALLQKEQAVVEVIIAVQAAYHNVINAQQGIKVAEEALANAQRKLSTTQRQVADGTASLVDLLTAENELLQAQNSVSAARMGLDMALLALLQTVGVDSTLAEARAWAERFVEAEDLTPVKWTVDLDAAVEYAKHNRLDLAMLQKQLEMAKLDIDAVASRRDWKLSLTGTTIRNEWILTGSVDTDRLLVATVARSKVKGSEENPLALSTGLAEDAYPQSGSVEDPWQVTAEFSYRFGDGGAKDAELEQAQAIYNSLQMQYEKLLNAIYLDVFSTRENMLQAWRVYEQSLKAREQAKAVYEQLEQAYAIGSISEQELLAGALLVTKAEADVIAAGLSYESSQTRFAASLGVPIETFLAGVSGKKWPVLFE